MLKLRKEQMKVLGQYTLEQFQNRMVVHLRTNFGEYTKDLEDSELQKKVEQGIKRAEGYSVTREDDIRRFLEYMVLLTTDFDTNPKTAWAGEILEDKKLNGTGKMNHIDDVALFSGIG